MTIKILEALTLVAVLLSASTAFAADLVEGYWKSVDDETGEATGYWKLEVKNGKLYGYLVNYPDAKSSDICDTCTGDLEGFKNKPIMGTAWLFLESRKGNRWEDGYIIDSGAGKKYKAKVWVEDGALQLRGYIGFFYKTQSWPKISQAQAEADKF